MSKLKVNELDTESGTTITVATGKTVTGNVTVPAGSTLNVSAGTLTPPAVMPASSAANLTNIPGANVTGTLPANTLGNAPSTDLTPIEDDIAVLGFQVAAASDLAQYNLRDQIVNTFQDATGVDTSASTGETRNAAGKYWDGSAVAGDVQVAFTASGAGTWSAPAGLANFRLLVVGGGGSSGYNGWSGGAGGAGGLVYISDWLYAGGGTVNYTIGAGGPSVTTTNTAGVVGSNTVWDSSGLHQIVTANGGGGGGVNSAPTQTQPGASGGGGGASSNVINRTGGTANQPASFGVYTNVGFGFDGGDTDSAGSPYYQSAGGGGAGGAAPDVVASDGASRGTGGLAYDASAVFGTGVGDSGWFAGGGGGAGHANRSNDGGYANGGDGSTQRPGGGGNGDNYSGTSNGGPGTANTGGGAGGKRNDTNSYAGGSGVIIIKYSSSTYNAMVLQSDATTAEAGTTDTADVVILYTPFAGTTTLNTDLVAAVSRDNGTTFTNVTLVGKGSYSGTTQIATAHNVDISGQPAGVAMKWKISTPNNVLAKQTRINGVSLGWS